MSKKNIVYLIIFLVVIALIITFNYLKSKSESKLNAMLQLGIITEPTNDLAGKDIPGITPDDQPDAIASLPTMDYRTLNKLTQEVYQNLTSINYGWIIGSPQLNVVAVNKLLALSDADLKYVAETFKKYYGKKLIVVIDDEYMPATDIDEKIINRLAALGYTLY